jgi:hypothetical protein
VFSVASCAWISCGSTRARDRPAGVHSACLVSDGACVREVLMDDRSQKGIHRRSPGGAKARGRREASPKQRDVHLTQYECLWEERFLQLREFIQEHGHSYVPGTRGALNRNELLGRWVETQRRFRKTGQLRQDRKQRLDAIGFDWEPMESVWVEMLGRCRGFRARYGHLAIPMHFAEDPELAAWAGDKRARYARGTLEDRHIQRLERLGFCWDLQLHVWSQNFEEYPRIWQRAGGHPTPGEVGRKLSEWLSSMRYYRERLSPEQLELLQSVNFAWEPRDELWEEKFSELVSHQRGLKSTSNPKRRYEVPGLGSWMSVQRLAKKRGTLSPEREARLDVSGFNWDPRREVGDQVAHDHGS